MSSRNQRLKGHQRQNATVFYQALLAARESLKAGNDVSLVKALVGDMLENKDGVSLEYFEVAESKNLNVLEIVKGADKPIMCIAGYVDDIRLIDNMFLD
jgi:pantoate--beta-alanine ligase